MSTPRAQQVGPSRRGFLAGAAVITGGLAAGGCGAVGPGVAVSPTVARRAPRSAQARREDLAILTAALAMERRTITAYAACIPLLADADSGWAKTFVGEEVQQADTLTRLIELDGAAAPIAHGAPAIGRARDGAQALTLLAALERDQIARYLAWIPQLSPGTMRATVASILAADAQHLAVLRGERGLAALTSAFVLGSGGRS